MDVIIAFKVLKTKYLELYNNGCEQAPFRLETLQILTCSTHTREGEKNQAAAPHRPREWALCFLGLSSVMKSHSKPERWMSPWSCATQQHQVESWRNDHFNFYWKTSALGAIIKDSEEESTCEVKLERMFA